VRATRVSAAVAATLAGAVIAGCGSSGATKPIAASTPVKAPAGDKKVVTAQAICDAAQPADVESTLSGASGPATPSEPKKGLHACSWTAVDTEHAVVAVVFDDAFDKNFVDDPVSLTNDLAGSNFPTATNVTLDVGAHNVTVYGLSEASDRVAYAPLSKIANTLNDVIVEADS
jgi:hypothetical protein